MPHGGNNTFTLRLSGKKKKKGGFDSTGSVISAELTGFEGGGD